MRRSLTIIHRDFLQTLHLEEEARRVIDSASKVASYLKDEEIRPEHLLLGLAHCTSSRGGNILKKLLSSQLDREGRDCLFSFLQEKMEKLLPLYRTMPGGRWIKEVPQSSSLPLSTSLRDLLLQAKDNSFSKKTTSAHFLLALSCPSSGGVAKLALENLGLSQKKISKELTQSRRSEKKKDISPTFSPTPATSVEDGRPGISYTLEEFHRAREEGKTLARRPLRSFAPSPEVLSKVPRHVAKEYEIVPLYMEEGALVLASLSPLDYSRADDLSIALGLKLRFYPASRREEIHRAIEDFYPSSFQLKEGMTIGGYKITGKVVEEVKKTYHTKDLPPSTSRRGSQKVGEYILEEKIAEGGYGEVWAGRHFLMSTQKVAIKFLKEDFSEEILIEEARFQSSLYSALEKENENREKGLARILSVNLDHRPPYLVSELVRPDSKKRISLRDHLENPLSISRVIEIFSQLISTLEAAHDQGFIHGDLKPENILIDGETGKVKIVDFGLANQRERSGEALFQSLEMTRTEKIRGTLPYMSPEQKEGQLPKAPSDIYSAGVILFEMVTGHRPQGREDMSQLRPGIPTSLDEIYHSCYNHRSQRYTSGRQLRQAWQRKGLNQYLSKEDAVSSPSPPHSQSSPTGPAGPFASFAERFLAFAVDLSILIPFVSIPLIFLSFPLSFALFYYGATSFLYFSWATSRWGGTPGKLAFDLQVVDSRQKKLSFLAAGGRWLGYFFTLLLLGLGLVLMLLHPERRSLCDFMGESWVIRREK